MIDIFDNVKLFGDGQILAVFGENDSTSLFDDKNMSPGDLGGMKYAKWGNDNLLPQHVWEKIDKSDIVGTNVSFNWKVCFGLGPKLVRLIYDNRGRISDYEEIHEGKEYEWYERNDISLYLMNSLTDLYSFYNAWTELIPNMAFTEIASIRAQQAMFCRWQLDAKKRPQRVLVSADWKNGATTKNTTSVYCVDEYDAVNDINKRLKEHTPRMMYATYMPSPGRPYYSQPTWYSIFKSGWYDQLQSIPALKKTILKHNLGVNHIIYISPEYFEEKERQEGIAQSDTKARIQLKNKLIKEIEEKLTGESNAGKAIVSLQKQGPQGAEKYITIEKIDQTVSGGEYISDVDTASNIVSYSMETNPALIGVPGKSAGSLSGTNQRELYLIKQALNKPILDRAMRVFSVIKQVNKWPKDYAIVVPEYIFTSLDQNKSGKQESTNNVMQ